MFSRLYNDHLEIDRWNKREIAIIDDFLAIFEGKDYKWEDLSILWSKILRLYVFIFFNQFSIDNYFNLKCGQ